MADDSLDIKEPFDFHPCDTPRGMLHYDLRELPPEAQIELNNFKRNVIREDEKYLASHPEIRAVIAIITRHILLHQPRRQLPAFIGEFFSRSPIDIQSELKEYIQSREPHIYEGNSAVGLNKLYIKEESDNISSSILEKQEELEECVKTASTSTLNEIAEEAYKRLEIDETHDVEWYLKNMSSDSEENTSIVKSIVYEILQNVNDAEEAASKDTKNVVTLFSGTVTEISSSTAVTSDVGTDDTDTSEVEQEN